MMTYHQSKRSRLQRLATATAATLLSAGVAITVAASAAHADTISDFTLSWTTYPAADQIPMVKATMTAVLNDSNHQAVYNGSSCSGAKGSASPYYWYCFASTDSSSLHDGPFEDANNDGIADYSYDSSSWIPQGITGVSDALDDEDWNGNSGLIVSWYHNGSNGVRISVLNTATGRYRHVLLVNLFWNSALGRYDFKAVDVHAGGIVWYGDYLYMVDTNWGIRVFDTKHIFDLGASNNGTTMCSGIGWVNGSYCAATYKYAMTQVGFWQRPTASDSDNYCKGTGNPRFSYISLDRSTAPDRLIVGEYCPGSASSNGRLVAYDMNNGSTVTHQLNDGTPDDYWTLPLSNIQGVATNDLYFYLNQSKGHDNGLMYKALASSHTMSLSNPALTVPIGPEDLTLHRGSATFFSVTEHLHSGQQGRMIYAAPTIW